MEKTVIQSGKIAGSFAARRWRLWEWVNGKIDRKLTEREPLTPYSLHEIWSKIFRRELLDGDYIHLKKDNIMSEGWYLSEWVPKAPGQIWKETNLSNLTPEQIASGFRTSGRNFHSLEREVRECFIDNFLTNHSHWESQFKSKESLAKQGFASRLGVYRPSLNPTNDDQYALMSISSGKEYMIDMAFPILVSRQVYRKFQEASREENSVEIEGIIKIREIQHSNAFKKYIKTVGSNHDESFENIIMNPLSIPDIMGEIISPLDISTKTNGSHPFMTLRVDGYNIDTETRDEIPAISRSVVLNPTEKLLSNISDTKDFDKKRFSLDFLLEDDYQFGTIMSPATDFDGRIRHYYCEYPVEENPFKSKK